MPVPGSVGQAVLKLEHSGARQCDLHALEISHGLVAAAVDVLLAHDQHLVAVARPRIAIAADDADGDVARHRVEECRAGGTGRDVDVAGAERRDHLAAAVEDSAFRLESFLGEIALLHRNEDGEVARRIRDRDVDLVGGEGRTDATCDA